MTLKGRPTVDLVVLFIAGLVGVVLVAITAAVIVLKVIHPEEASDALMASLLSLVDVLVGVVVGYVTGRVTTTHIKGDDDA